MENRRFKCSFFLLNRFYPAGPLKFLTIEKETNANNLLHSQ